MSNDKHIVSQVLTEFLEIAIHNILKIREIYPDSIFVKKQKYGIIVYQAIHPQLKEYIANCMQAVLEIAKENQLEKVVLCFIKYHSVHEKIVFDILKLKHDLDRDPFLLDVEKSFRTFFCRLHSLNEYLYPVTNDVTFALQIHTIESSGIAYMENPNYQNFPWMQIKPYLTNISESEIIPLETVDNDFVNIQIFIEQKI